jgi:hypothetical protein
MTDDKLRKSLKIMVLQERIELSTSPLPIKVGVENAHEIEVFWDALKYPFMIRLRYKLLYSSRKVSSCSFNS